MLNGLKKENRPIVPNLATLRIVIRNAQIWPYKKKDVSLPSQAVYLMKYKLLDMVSYP